MTTDWRAFFQANNFSLKEYYNAVKENPDEFVYILAGFNDEARPVITIPEKAERVKKAKAAKAPGEPTKRKTKTRKFYNVKTHQLVECSASAIIKEDSPLGVVLKRGERDALTYYNKTKHDWKLFNPETDEVIEND